MKLNLLWEYIAIINSANKFYGDPISQVNKKNPMHIKHKSGFSGGGEGEASKKREKDDMSFLVGGEKDRNKFLKTMNIGNKL
jgi:hypothetical protein